MKQLKRTLIFHDTEHLKNSIDLLAAADKIYGETPFESYGIVIDSPWKPLSGYFQHIITLSREVVEPHDQITICEIIEKLQKKYHFDSILVPATPFGRMIAPRLAKRLNTGIVADVTDIHWKDGRVEIIRPAYSGRIMAAIVTRGKGPVMMSVRPGVFNYTKKRDRETEVWEYTAPGRVKSCLKCLEIKEKKISYDIRESEILISGGGGVEGNFSALQRLAAALKGEVSASKKIVEQGIASRSIQVGQSGKSVSPKLYIALGINGAIQHVEGLKNIESIISVNTDKNAPICTLSDMVVEGDAVEFIHKLTDRIEAFRNEAKGEEG
jgi:electron transfer flavoprotein alpha subunit